MGCSRLSVVACHVQDASASRHILFPKHSFDLGTCWGENLPHNRFVVDSSEFNLTRLL